MGWEPVWRTGRLPRKLKKRVDWWATDDATGIRFPIFILNRSRWTGTIVTTKPVFVGRFTMAD